MSFLELARAAERRLWGCDIREKSLSLSSNREAKDYPPREKSETSEERSRQAYAFPWPDQIPGLGRRHIEAFTHCDNCGTGTWAFYGRWALCIRCANLGRLR